MQEPQPNALIRSASCVIPAYNAAQTIGRALASVLATPGIGEVIVVDDGSADDTAATVEAIAATAVRPVRLMHQANAGAAAARNTGMKAATGEWITFLDADDEMLPDAISAKAAHLAGCPDPDGVDAVHGSFVRGDTGRIGQFAETFDRVDRDGIGRPGGFPGGVVSFAFRRQPLLATQGFRTDLQLFEDFELILRLIAQGARLVGGNAPGFHRHYTAGSLSRGTALAQRLRIERQFLRIAAEDRLMSRAEIARRRWHNRARQVFFTVTRR